MTTPRKLDKLEAIFGERIAKSKKRTGDRDAFARYAQDPVGFIRDVLDGDKLWHKQLEICEAVRDHPLVVVRGGNSLGKDHISARLALWAVYAAGYRVLLLGPTDRQVTEILVRREIFRAWHAGKRRGLWGELFTHSLRLNPDGEADILAMTSTDVGKLTGFHGDKVMCILTEGQDIEDASYEAALANATGERDRILVVGNPLRPLGKFYTICKPNSQWHKIKVSAAEHPNVVEGREVIKGAVTRAWVERQRKEYGVGSPIYVARVEADFPETAEDALVTRAWLERAAQHHERGTFASAALSHDYVAGVDVARGGADRSCLVLMRGAVVESISTWRGAKITRTCGKIIKALREHLIGSSAPTNPLFVPKDPQYGPGIMRPDCHIVVDSTGLGVGVPDRLGELGYIVSEYYAAGQPREKQRFLNRRAEDYWHLRKMLEDGAIALPNDEELFEELLATRYILGSNGKIQIEGKKEIRTRLGRSPDKADALVYATAAADEASGGGEMLDF